MKDKSNMQEIQSYNSKLEEKKLALEKLSTQISKYKSISTSATKKIEYRIYQECGINMGYNSCEGCRRDKHYDIGTREEVDHEKRKRAQDSLNQAENDKQKLLVEIRDLQKSLVEQAHEFLSQIDLTNIHRLESILTTEKDKVQYLINIITTNDETRPASDSYLHLQEIYTIPNTFTVNNYTVTAFKNLAILSKKPNFPFTRLSFKCIPEAVDPKVLSALVKQVEEIIFTDSVPTSTFLESLQMAKSEANADYKVKQITIKNLTLDKDIQLKLLVNENITTLHLDDVKLMPSFYQQLRDINFVLQLKMSKLSFSRAEIQSEFRKIIFDLIKNEGNPKSILFNEVDIKDKYHRFMQLLDKLRAGQFDDLQYAEIKKLREEIALIYKESFNEIWIELETKLNDILESIVDSVALDSSKAHKILSQKIVHEYEASKRKIKLLEFVNKNIFDIDYHKYQNENFQNFIAIKKDLYYFNPNMDTLYLHIDKLQQCFGILKKLSDEKYLPQNYLESLQNDLAQRCQQIINMLIADKQSSSLILALHFAKQYRQDEVNRIYTAYVEFLHETDLNSISSDRLMPYIKETIFILTEIDQIPSLKLERGLCFKILIQVAKDLNFHNLSTAQSNELINLLLPSLQKIPKTRENREILMETITELFKKKVSLLIKDSCSKEIFSHRSEKFEGNLFDRFKKKMAMLTEDSGRMHIMLKNIDVENDLSHIKNHIDKQISDLSVINKIVDKTLQNALEKISLQIDEVISLFELPIPSAPPVENEFDEQKSLSDVEVSQIMRNRGNTILSQDIPLEPLNSNPRTEKKSSKICVAAT